MAPNLGVRCSPRLSTVGVNGVTEARKIIWAGRPILELGMEQEHWQFAASYSHDRAP